jgi:hypothetical protein
MLLYRTLVHNRIHGAVALSIPRAVELLGVSRLKRDVAKFLDEQPSTSPYLRDVVSDFVGWARPSWQADSTLPPYLGDLARHELLTFELAAQERGECPTFDAAVKIDRPLAFRAPVRIVQYDFAVHCKHEELSGAPTPVLLLGYRDGAHRVRFLELGPVAAAVLSLLLSGETLLRDAIFEGCERVGVGVDDAVLSGIAELLADLAERGVLLGSAGPAGSK